MKDVKNRVAYFINMMTQQNKKFENPFDAYTYIKNCLKTTELDHGVMSGGMILPESQYNVEYGIYVIACMNQAVLISLNGAYGIFQSPTAFKTQELGYYRDTQNITLINIPSATNKSLWQK